MEGIWAALAIVFGGTGVVAWLVRAYIRRVDKENQYLREDRDHYREIAERVVHVQERVVPAVKEAVQSAPILAESLDALARAVEQARKQLPREE